MRETALEALGRLLSAYTKRGRSEAALQTATRLLALDPLQESVHRALMRLYVGQGRRGAALRQYQSCVELLQRELGVEPDAETKRLYQEILQQQSARAASAAGRGQQPGSGARADAPATGTPLVGRDPEVVRWRAILQDVWKSRGRALFVTGEAGIGKSRLVEDLTAEASRAGARVVIGRAYETEQILPFRPWVDALRAARALADPAAIWSRHPHWRVELARLFPELAERGVRPSITSESHLRLFETLDGLLGRLATAQPLLVVFEDLHWADEMSLRLLSFVARRLASRPIALVATARDEELADAPVLKRLLEELVGAPHVVHVPLGPLSADATTALVRALARAGNDSRVARLAEKVRAISEGNPFVIVETMRAFQGERPDAAAVELPRRVRDMITARLERLSARARHLASVAAVIEHEFDFGLLQRTAGLSRRDTAEGVEELVRRHVFDAVGERFDFTHVRIRNAIYDAGLGPRRPALHAAVGEALERLHAGRLEEIYDRLAYHFSRAHEPAKAFAYLVHLADKAARRYALDEAARVLQDALRYADHLPRDQRLAVVYRLAHVLALLGRPAEVRDLLLAQEALIAGLREPSLSGPYHFWLAYTYANLGESERALANARRALEEAARCGDEVTMGQASYALARESYMIGRALEGITHGRQAVALLERGDERWWLGQALWVLALNLHHIGDFAPALDAMDRMREIGEAIGEIRLQTYAAWTTGRTYTLMGETDAAIAAGRRGLELAADPVARANALGWLGAAHLENEDAAQAIPLLEGAIDQFQHISGAGGYRYRQVDGMLTALVGEAYLLKGELDRASELASRALEISTVGGWRVAVGYAERALGRVALASGKLDAADEYLRRARETFVSIDARCQVARSHLALADVALARGDRDGARRAAEAAAEMFAEMRAPRLVERAERVLSRVAEPR